MHASANGGYSQSLNTRIDVEMSNESLAALFKKITEETGLSFVFPHDEVDKYPNISVSFEQRSVRDILDIVFTKKNLSYRLKGNTIFISVEEDKKKRGQRKGEPVDESSITRPDSLADKRTRRSQRDLIPITVSGTVKDASTQEPLAGANIVVKGTTRGTTTDGEGRFSIDVEDNEVLIFSFIGFTPQEILVNGQSTINILLAPDRTQLQEVIVVGYGKQREATVTSAVSQIQGEELTRRPVSNVQQSLQGLMPGVTVLDRGGPPGRSAATIRVRGVTTFNIENPAQFSTYGGFDLTKNDALVIIDGIEQRLTDINPDDIESITVLKDASSTAIYGSRATNGVILITTKRAKGDAVTVSYHGYYGVQESINQPKMMGLEAYMRMQVAAYTNSGAALPARFTEESIQNWVNATDRETYPLPNTWFETVLSPAPQHNHSLSVAGGNEVLRARLSGRYMDQDGIAPNFRDKLNEFKLNTDLTASKNLTFSADFNYRVNNSQVPTVDPFQNILHGSLWAVPKFADGTYGLSSQGNNPLMYAEIGGLSKLNNEFIVASGKAEVTIIDGLKFSTQYAVRAHSNDAKNFTNAYVNRDKVTGIVKTVATNRLVEVRNSLREYTWNNILTYQRVFANKHESTFLAGYSEIHNVQANLSASRERFFNNDIQSIDQGTNDATKNNSGNDAEFGLRSYFGRINYAFDNKYLLEINGRYDGSSKFAEGRRYSFFPSLSAGWRISEESFWNSLDDITDDFKIRASWGRTGNQSVDLYSYYAALSLTTYTLGGAPVQGYRQATLANKDLGWETTTQSNVGFDVSFLNNRLGLTVDYYNKVTDDILLNLAIPATVGLNAPPQNAGSVENKGWEFLLSYRNQHSSGFRYNFSTNFSINDNKVIDLKGTGPYIYGASGSGDNYPRYTIAEGLPINTLWGHRTDGLFQTQAEVDSYPTYAANSKPGDVKYLDLNEDNIIDAKDMTELGYTFPKYTFGLSADFGFKNFELNILLQGAAKVSTRLGGALSDHGNFEAFAHEILTDNYWTPENPNARFPRPLKFDFRNNITSDRTVLDASYLRVKNIQLAYRLPASLIQRVNLDMVRVYVSGTNLITFSGLNEWNIDPEVEPGVAVYYPQVSLYSLGINVQF
jgi:TonB-linked SusC/RagA family outer membrane protein